MFLLNASYYVASGGARATRSLRETSYIIQMIIIDLVVDTQWLDACG